MTDKAVNTIRTLWPILLLIVGFLLSKGLDAFSSNDTALAKDMAETKTKINEMQIVDTEIKTREDALEQRMNRQFGELTDRLVRIEDKIDKLKK